jgi:hypothetical protein
MRIPLAMPSVIERRFPTDRGDHSRGIECTEEIVDRIRMQPVVIIEKEDEVTIRRSKTGITRAASLGVPG